MTQTSPSKGGKTWVTADPHFGHTNICKFTNFDGTPVRPWDDVNEMTEALIANWNSVVHDDDRVYLLGDVAMNRKGLDQSLPRLKGRIVLVRGNHDIDKLSYYSNYFEDVRACVVKKGFVLSHIPIHPDCMDRWGVNIHGHLHNNTIKLPDKSEDNRYVCVSVEKTGYFPVELTKVLEAQKIVSNPDQLTLGL